MKSSSPRWNLLPGRHDCLSPLVGEVNSTHEVRRTEMYQTFGETRGVLVLGEIVGCQSPPYRSRMVGSGPQH
jgi:hypothetical protein